MHDFFIMIAATFIYVACGLGIILGIYHLLHDNDDKLKINNVYILKWFGWSLLIVTIFLSTNSLPNQVVKLKEISKNELKLDYALSNDLTINKEPKSYKFVNKKTGYIIDLHYSEYVKAQCDDFIVNVFEVKRAHEIIGFTFIHDYYNIVSQIECR